MGRRRRKRLHFALGHASSSLYSWTVAATVVTMDTTLQMPLTNNRFGHHMQALLLKL